MQSRADRVRTRWIPVALALTVLALGPWSLALADSIGTVVKVEEDWELVIDVPESGSAGPQITCTLSPRANLEGVYSVLTLNHQSHPSFVPGGIQLQVWDWDVTLDAPKFPQNNMLSTSGETVRWTQSMQLSNGTLQFDVTSGSSTTWGNFGGQGYLRSTAAVNLVNLNGYSPASSVSNSGVNFAANRVRSLVLKRVRLTTSIGEVLEDNTQRVVHQQN